MATTTTYGSSRDPLAEYLLGTVLTTAQENRKAVEIKWNRNRAIRHADANLDPRGTWKRNERKGKWKSDTFVAIGRQKIIAAHSVLHDAMFKDGKVPFQTLIEDMGEETEAIENNPAEAAFVDNQVEWEQLRLTRQLKACDAVMELSMALDDDLTYGECWVHTYESDEVIPRLRPVAPGVMEPYEERRPMLGFEHVSPWEMFYDLESGRDPRGWSYLMRQQQKSPSDIARMDTGDGTYNPVAIRRVLEVSEKHHGEPNVSAGSGDTAIAPKVRNLPRIQKTEWVREWFVDVPADKIARFERQWQEEIQTGREAVGEIADGGTDDLADPKPWDMVRVWAITADNEVIAYQRDAQPTYYRTECEPNNDEPHGIGVADKMEFVTKVLNGMVRSYENNAKLLSNLVAAVKRELIVGNPEDSLGDEGGLIDLAEDCDDARKAVQQVTFQNILGPLVEGIRMFLEFADYESQIPRAEQGAQSNNPQTAFELQQRLDRSGKYLGGVTSRFDRLIAWAVGNMSAYNQGNPAENKGVGNFRVIATGFSSFQNQVIRLNKLLQTLGTILASEQLTRMHKLEWLLREIYKAQDIDPDQLMKSPEEMQENEQSEAESQQTQLTIAMLQAQLAAEQARARKDEASAQKILADIEIAREKTKTDRARAIAGIEGKVMQRREEKTNKPGAASPKAGGSQ